MKRQGVSKRNITNSIIWGVVVLLSAAAIFMGNRIVTSDFSLFHESGGEFFKGRVLEVVERTASNHSLGETEDYTNEIIVFTCKIVSGSYKGETVTCEQAIDNLFASSESMKIVEAGDTIMLFDNSGGEMPEPIWQFADYYRFDKIVMLFVIFMGLVLLLGRWKGINTLLSLSFTALFVFMVFVPAVMSGRNIYISVAITCIYTILMTLTLINGVSRKTLATIIGCMAGTVVAALVTSFMSKFLELTGYIDEDSFYLTIMNPDKPIDLTAIIFATIIIGAMGALMDVAMDISSSLFELHEHVPDMTFQTLFKSGMNIGRDIMGTMANTLVLAYIGSSLSGIMLLLTYSHSLMDILNREIIIVELLQALIGSLAILLTIPFTVVVCGLLYLKKGKPKPSTAKRLAD